MNLLIGAALALAAQLIVQLVVVPKVQTRARREARLEQVVRDLKELLTTAVSERSSEARVAQGLVWDLWQLEAESRQDQYRIGKIRGDQIRQARKATNAFTDLAHTRVGLLTDEIKAFRPGAPEIVQLEATARRYWLAVAFISEWRADDAETQIEKRWADEIRMRQELIRQAQLLAALPRPPRTPLRRHARYWIAGRVRSAISWARSGVRRPAISRTR
jgi:hypothetical protein